ncbi:MAG: flagellar hook-length control protein FliK [Elusimicrobiota bacterium]
MKLENSEIISISPQILAPSKNFDNSLNKNEKFETSFKTVVEKQEMKPSNAQAETSERPRGLKNSPRAEKDNESHEPATDDQLTVSIIPVITPMIIPVQEVSVDLIVAATLLLEITPVQNVIGEEKDALNLNTSTLLMMNINNEAETVHLQQKVAEGNQVGLALVSEQKNPVMESINKLSAKTDSEKVSLETTNVDEIVIPQKTSSSQAVLDQLRIFEPETENSLPSNKKIKNEEQGEIEPSVEFQNVDMKVEGATLREFNKTDFDFSFLNQNKNTSSEISHFLFQTPNPIKENSVFSSPASGEVMIKSHLPTEQKVVDQIIQKFSVIQQAGQSQAQIELEPKELGKLKMVLTMDQDSVIVKFNVESQRVKEIVQAHLPQLKDSLLERGFTVERFDVAMMASGHNMDHSGDKHQGPKMPIPYRKFDVNEFVNNEMMSGVVNFENRRVNVFA